MIAALAVVLIGLMLAVLAIGWGVHRVVRQAVQLVARSAENSPQKV